MTDEERKEKQRKWWYNWYHNNGGKAKIAAWRRRTGFNKWGTNSTS